MVCGDILTALSLKLRFEQSVSGLNALYRYTSQIDMVLRYWYIFILHFRKQRTVLDIGIKGV